MRTILIAVATLSACTDAGPDPELPLGIWRNGAWTCLDGCGGAPPALTAATQVEVSEGVVRWYNAGGAVVDMADGTEDGLCWHVGALDLCGDVCGSVLCARVDAAALGAQSWQFEATR